MPSGYAQGIHGLSSSTGPASDHVRMPGAAATAQPLTCLGLARHQPLDQCACGSAQGRTQRVRRRRCRSRWCGVRERCQEHTCDETQAGARGEAEQQVFVDHGVALQAR